MNKATSRSSTRPAFTMIETLVVVAVIGFLACLTLSATMQARSAARKAECMNNLNQIGIALHSHQSAFQTFPVPMPGRAQVLPYPSVGESDVSGYYELLPHLDLAPLYNSINLSRIAPPHTYVLSAKSLANSTAIATTVRGFQCPEDDRLHSGIRGAISYRFNVGSSNPSHPRLPEPVGAFRPSHPAPPRDYMDGLSQTIGFSERLIGGFYRTTFNPRRDMWGAGVAGLFQMNDEAVAKVCATTAPAEPSSPSAPYAPSAMFVEYLGESWLMGGNYYIWYNHVLPPNQRASDCVAGDINSEQGPYCTSCSISARSNHSGGVAALVMDGGVRFVRDSIHPSVWRALGTRAAGDAVSGDW